MSKYKAEIKLILHIYCNNSLKIQEIADHTIHVSPPGQVWITFEQNKGSNDQA